jgi:hypothetical protein
MAERRASPRQRAFVPGRVDLPVSTAPVYCSIRDLSSEGALLAFGTMRDMPATFELAIPSKGWVCVAETRWQRGREVGVRFVSVELDRSRTSLDQPSRSDAFTFEPAILANRRGRR